MSTDTLLKAPLHTPSPLCEVYNAVADAVCVASNLRWETARSPTEASLFIPAARGLASARLQAYSRLAGAEIWLRANAPDALAAFHAALKEIEPINHACADVLLCNLEDVSDFLGHGFRPCADFPRHPKCYLNHPGYCGDIQAFFAGWPEVEERALLERMRTPTALAAAALLDHCVNPAAQLQRGPAKGHDSPPASPANDEGQWEPNEREDGVKGIRHPETGEELYGMNGLDLDKEDERLLEEARRRFRGQPAEGNSTVPLEEAPTQDEARPPKARMSVDKANRTAMGLTDTPEKRKKFFALSERKQAKRIGCSWETWSKTACFIDAVERGWLPPRKKAIGNMGASRPSVVSLTPALEATVGVGEPEGILQQLVADETTAQNWNDLSPEERREILAEHEKEDASDPSPVKPEPRKVVHRKRR